ncbi:hypothetical protein ACFYWX_12305 [Streptomyces sp. NPDC002888]|uniref:hypothetical protein n=1 Tax=Streptomyces sp. NPDC002888 TaxID=3364668 RepID=UPI00369AFAA1
MDWATLAATGLGALVGVGSTLLADRVRWQRDLTERNRQERKEIYVACLTKYRQAYEDMYAAANRTADGATGDGVTRDAAVREVFRASGSDEVRESALICAPQEMSDAIEAVYATLRELMEVLAAGNPPLDSPEFQEHRLRHARAVWDARAAMRGDLERRV